MRALKLTRATRLTAAGGVSAAGGEFLERSQGLDKLMRELKAVVDEVHTAYTTDLRPYMPSLRCVVQETILGPHALFSLRRC